MLKLVLPKGSLERATLELFEAADLAVNRSSSVDYKATIDDPRVAEVRILRPQEIPRYVADGLFDLRITGSDLERFAATVGFSVARKQAALNVLLAETKRYATKPTTQLVSREPRSP